MPLVDEGSEQEEEGEDEQVVNEIFGKPCGGGCMSFPLHGPRTPVSGS